MYEIPATNGWDKQKSNPDNIEFHAGGDLPWVIANRHLPVHDGYPGGGECRCETCHSVAICKRHQPRFVFASFPYDFHKTQQLWGPLPGIQP